MRSSKLCRVGNILGKLRTKVLKSSMRSSKLCGVGNILGKLKTKVPKSSMRSSNVSGDGGGGLFLVSSQLKSSMRNFISKGVFFTLHTGPSTDLTHLQITTTCGETDK